MEKYLRERHTVVTTIIYSTYVIVVEKGDDYTKIRTHKKGLTPCRVPPESAAFLILILLVGCISQPPEPGIPESGVTSSVDTIAADLKGLPIDEFFEESYKQLLLRNPEYLTELGIANDFGLRNNQLTNISDAYIKETQKLQIAILELLREYNRDELTRDQQISYDVYEWYLDDLVRGHEYMYYDYPVTHFITGIQNQLTMFFTDIHPVSSKQDAEDYVTCLSQVDTKFDQLIEGLKLREEAGVIPPKFVIQWSLYGMRSTAGGTARYLPFYTAFEEKVDALQLSTEETQELLEAAEKEITASVIPAFQALVEYLEHLESVAPTDDGVWQFPNGDKYYEYP